MSGEEYYFDHREASRAERFFEQYLRYPDGPLQGKPFRLLPWQRARVVRPFFGWKRKRDNKRRYKVLYLELPKKQGKSAFGTGLAMFFCLADRENSPTVYCVAGSRDQAGIIFKECRKMVQLSPALAAMCTPLTKTVVSEWNHGSIGVLSSDASKSHGYKPSAVLFDELHVQPNSRLKDALTGAGLARRQSVHCYLTTAGDKKHGVGWDEHQYALRVATGEIDDPTYLSVIYAADPKDPTWEESTWYRCNPSLERPGQKEGEFTVTLSDFRDIARRARNGSPSDVRSFRQLHLNIWGEPAAGFFAVPKWDACDDPIDMAALHGRRCWAGMDLSDTSDITNIALVFEPDEHGVVAVLSFSFLPKETIAKRVRVANVPYDRWIAEGHIEATPGEAIEREIIYSRFMQLAARYRIVAVGIDPYKADELGTAIESSGVPVVKIVQLPRGLSEATKELEIKILRREIAHGGNPVLRWSIGNAIAKQDEQGNVMLSKKRSPEKIDPVMALVDGFAAMALAEPEPESVYLTKGLHVTE